MTRLFSTETQWLSGQSINILNRPGAVHTLRFVEIFNKIYFLKTFIPITVTALAFCNFQELWSCLQKLQTKSFFVLLWTDSENWSQENCQKITIYQNIKHQQWLTEWSMNNTDCGLQSWEDIAKSCQKVYKLVENIFRICITFFLCILHSVLTDLAARENQKKKLRFTLL